MKYWMIVFLFCFCTPRPPSSSKNLCFDQNTSIGKIVQISNSKILNCQLYDYIRIYPIQNNGCEFWKNSYGNAEHIHFNKIFWENVNQFICFKQQYLNVRDVLSKRGVKIKGGCLNHLNKIDNPAMNLDRFL